jgi:hypothetical protein
MSARSSNLVTWNIFWVFVAIFSNSSLKMALPTGRSFAPKIMVVITDGRSASPALTALQADLAKAEGLTVIAVGVGSAIFRDELENIAKLWRGVLNTTLCDKVCQ